MPVIEIVKSTRIRGFHSAEELIEMGVDKFYILSNQRVIAIINNRSQSVLGTYRRFRIVEKQKVSMHKQLMQYQMGRIPKTEQLIHKEYFGREIDPVGRGFRIEVYEVN